MNRGVKRYKNMKDKEDDEGEIVVFIAEDVYQLLTLVNANRLPLLDGSISISLLLPPFSDFPIPSIVDVIIHIRLYSPQPLHYLFTMTLFNNS